MAVLLLNDTDRERALRQGSRAQFRASTFAGWVGLRRGSAITSRPQQITAVNGRAVAWRLPYLSAHVASVSNDRTAR